jgi:uncharacterized membrane protein
MPDDPSREPTPAYSRHVEENIESVADLERSFEEAKTLPDRIVDAIGSFSGSLLFVGLHVTWFALWILINTGHCHGLTKFDPYPFALLSTIVSVEAVLLSSFVLMKQNQLQRRSDHRDHLNLQIGLLSEKEITKTLQLLSAVARKLKVDESHIDEELEEMAEHTSVDMLAERIQSELPLE